MGKVIRNHSKVKQNKLSLSALCINTSDHMFIHKRATFFVHSFWIKAEWRCTTLTL